MRTEQKVLAGFFILGLLVSSIAYILASPVNNHLVEIGLHHGKALSLIQDIQSKNMLAVKESLAYLLSGETSSKNKFLAWNRNFPAIFKRFTDYDSSHNVQEKEEEKLSDQALNQQKTLSELANKMFVEFEEKGLVSSDTFNLFQSTIEKLDSNLRLLVEFGDMEIAESYKFISEEIQINKNRIYLVGAITLFFCYLFSCYLYFYIKWENLRKAIDKEKLITYANELERSNKELDEFASIASHDLQEPLRKIVTFGDFLKNKATNLDAHSLEYIERMEKAAIRMKRFIEDLISYSRISTKQKPPEPVNLEIQVTAVIEEMAHIIHQSNGVAKIKNLPTVEGYSNQLYQLMANLITNAFKYKKKDQPPVVNVSGRKIDNGYWEISIEDNGIGFNEKYADRIFQPFQRLHGRSEYEGSGLGLTICKKIVNNHLGTISAKSKPDEGTTFIITLPEKQPNSSS